MPSTYTTSNGIEKIGIGEQSDTWGSTTNTNFDLIDEALDGQVTESLSAVGTTGSPNTVTITDGASSVGRHRRLTISDAGDLGGTAYVQLGPNDAEKLIWVTNSLSGSRDVILFQGTYNASNDYQLGNGETALLAFNGGGSGAVVSRVTLGFNPASVAITGGTLASMTSVGIGEASPDKSLHITSGVDDDLKIETAATFDAGVLLSPEGTNSWSLSAQVAGHFRVYNEVSSTEMLSVTDGTDDILALTTAATNGVFIDMKPEGTSRWKIGTTTAGEFQFKDVVTATTPMKVEVGAANDTLVLDANSRIGVGTAAPGVVVDISSTDAVQLPAGTEAQEPTATAGRVRWNSDDSMLSVADGTNFRNIPFTGYPAADYTGAAQNVPSTGGTRTWTHGLGGIPTHFQAYLRCTSATGGYAVNDVISVSTTIATGGFGITVYADATEITFGVINPTEIARAGAGNTIDITTGNFDVFVLAWA